MQCPKLHPTLSNHLDKTIKVRVSTMREILPINIVIGLHSTR